MISVAMYKEESLDDGKSQGTNNLSSSRQNSMGSEFDIDDHNDELEGHDDSLGYKLYAKVSKIKNDKIKFKVFTINLMFSDEESLDNAKDAEFCILSRFIAFKFLNE